MRKFSDKKKLNILMHILFLRLNGCRIILAEQIRIIAKSLVQSLKVSPRLWEIKKITGFDSVVNIFYRTTCLYFSKGIAQILILFFFFFLLKISFWIICHFKKYILDTYCNFNWIICLRKFYTKFTEQKVVLYSFSKTQQFYFLRTKLINFSEKL